MSNLKALIKINVLAMLRAGSKKALNRSYAMLILAFLALAFVFGFQMYVFSDMMAPYLKVTNSLETLISLAVFLPAVINLSMGMYKIPGYLFGFKDYDMLMSLPIKESAVLTAKIFPLYMSDMLYSIIISAPIFFVYASYSEVSAMFYVACVVSWFFMPMLPLTIGAAISMAIAKLTSKTKGNLIQNIANMLMMLILMACFILINPAYSGGSTSMLSGIAAYYPTAQWLAMGISNPVYYVLFIAISLLPFALFILLFARSFKKINSINKNATSTSNYKVSNLQKSSVIKMLMLNERKRFFANSIIVLNSGFGVVLYVIAFGFLMIAGKSLFANMMLSSDLISMVFYLFCGVGLFVASTTLTTPFSISIEGKTLWHLKVLPIKSSDIFKAKVGFNLILTIPLIFVFNIITGIVFEAQTLEIIIGTFATLSIALFFPLFGMNLNLRVVNLDWRSADEVVKRGVSTTLSVLLGMLIVFALAFGYVFLGTQIGFIMYCLIAGGIFLMISIILWVRLIKCGERLLTKI